MTKLKILINIKSPEVSFFSVLMNYTVDRLPYYVVWYWICQCVGAGTTHSEYYSLHRAKKRLLKHSNLFLAL